MARSSIVSSCSACDATCCRFFEMLQVDLDEVEPIGRYLLEHGMAALIDAFQAREWAEGQANRTDGSHYRTFLVSMQPSCLFLRGNRCLIHPVRPHACRDFVEGGEKCHAVQHEAAEKSA